MISIWSERSYLCLCVRTSGCVRLVRSDLCIRVYPNIQSVNVCDHFQIILTILLTFALYKAVTLGAYILYTGIDLSKH